MSKTLLLTTFTAVVCFSATAADEDQKYWPTYQKFDLTSKDGFREEAIGPFYYHEERESQQLWAVPPLFSYARDPDVESAEFDILYPILSYDRYGKESRFHILQVFSFAGGQTQDETLRKRFTLFPFYFQQRSPNPEDNYTALLPIYGRLKNRLFRDEIRFILLPLYVQSKRRDIVTDNYLYPIFHLRKGNELSGWQVWPLVGHEHKNLTSRTNSADEVELIGGHDRFFALWPFFLKNHNGIGTDNPERQISVLPLFTKTRSPKRDSFTAPWPLGLTLTDDREKKYKEVGVPWPLIVFARGEGKRVSRVWPLYSRASSKTMRSDFYLWPVYKYNQYHAAPLFRERTRILFFLYSDINLKQTETGAHSKRRDLWPLFTYTRSLEGNERLQVLSILEPLLPNSKSIERNYSQLWSIWRSEKNVKTSSRSQSLLWNVYRREVSPEKTKNSFLHGLVQRSKGANGTTWKVFGFPLGGKPEKAIVSSEVHSSIAKNRGTSNLSGLK